MCSSRCSRLSSSHARPSCSTSHLACWLHWLAVLSVGALVAQVSLSEAAQSELKAAEQAIIKFATPSAPADWYNSEKCASWLTEYIAWHAEMRGKPGAQYLIYECQPDNSDCGFGLGDRLRGVMLAMRVAAVSKRVVLVKMQAPIPLEQIFNPSMIDWIGTNISLPANTVKLKTAEAVSVCKRQELSSYADVTALVIEGWNEIHNARWPGLPVSDWDGWSAHCMFRAMFRPSQQVLEAVVALQRKMGLEPGQPYIALHLRLGGMVGEGSVHRHDDLTALHHGIRCGRELQVARKLNSTALVLITDNLELKELLQEGAFDHVRTTDTVPIHFANVARQNLGLEPAAFVNTVADMGVMAASECMVADIGGGFALQARLWGGLRHISNNYGCFQNLNSCLEQAGMKRRRVHGKGHQTPARLN